MSEESDGDIFFDDLPKIKPARQPKQYFTLSDAILICSKLLNKEGVAYLKMMAVPEYVPYGTTAKAKLTDIVIAKRGEDYSLERGSCTDFMAYVEGKGPESTKQLAEEQYNLGQLVEEAQTFGKQRASALGIDNVFVVIKPNEPLDYLDGMAPPDVIKGPIALVARDKKLDFTKDEFNITSNFPGDNPQQIDYLRRRINLGPDATRPV